MKFVAEFVRFPCLLPNRAQRFCISLLEIVRIWWFGFGGIVDGHLVGLSSFFCLSSKRGGD